MADLPLSEIQGFILRSYTMPALRVCALEVVDPAAARAFLEILVNDDPSTPQLRTAARWTEKPDYCVNVGITYSGLVVLQLPATSLASFPGEFIEGPVSRAARVGDTGESAPEQWIAQLATPRVHVLVLLFAQSDAILERVSGELRALYIAGGGFTELSTHDARALPGNVAHFGYRDGFAQPTLEGGLPPLFQDALPFAPPGEFLLGHPSQYTGFTYPVPVPAALGNNGTFLAFRILEQDCAGFEAFLADASTQSGLDPELIAAKLCGRWRGGLPLALSPSSPDEEIPLEKYNCFDYRPTDAVPDAHDNRRGERCPIGAHIRRMNPRSSVVAGNSGLKRRLVRRGLPYGPPYDPEHPDDGIERGLVGLFIGVSLKDQFEFLMSDWGNKGAFAPGLQDTRDPIIGDNSKESSRFLIPVAGRREPIALTGLSRFVRTRGAAYCFVPSVSGLKVLSRASGN